MQSVIDFSLRHRRLVALTWLALAVIGALTVSSTTGRLTHTLATPGTPGFDANQRIEKRFGLDGNEQPTIAVLRLPPGQSMRTAAGRQAAARTFAAAHRAGHLGVADYANTGNPKLISADGRTTWALISMPNPDVPLGQGVIDRIPHALRAAAPPGATVAITGFEQLQSNAGGGGGPSTLVETLIGMAGALVVLALVFGSPLAVVPLLIAVPSILSAFLFVGAIEHLTDISFLVEYLVALIGLGVSIDYALLVVTRWREERERGLDNQAAIRAAGATAGRAVVLSGLTVAIGLLSLVVLPVPFLRSVGYGGMLIPLVSLVAAITLLPALLAAWGPALDRHRLTRTSATFSPGWAKWGSLVVRRRWIAGAVGLAIVRGLAVPALSMNTGQASTSAFPTDTPAARALQDLGRQGVPEAVVFPVQALVHGGPSAARRVVAIADRTPGVYAAVAPASPSFRRGHDVLVNVIPRTQGSTAAGRQLVNVLRARLAAVPGVEVGGNTAQNKDFVTAVYGNFPLMLGLIALLTFVLLARALRSVVLALKAVVLNVISLGAAYGFLVLFWQQGHGSNLVYGVPSTGATRDFIPILVFAFLFGLSMDYEVFLLARMREEHDSTGSTRQAVVGGLGHTGKLVTSGALILAISFLSLSTNPDLPVRVIATALAFGILLDAFVVRTLLVPALVALFGRWNWWMPARLGRLLRVSQPAATARPAARPENRQPPRKVPSKAR
jgi:RND superfamily putative drug exporter